jgi:hypothetical protein
LMQADKGQIKYFLLMVWRMFLENVFSSSG